MLNEECANIYFDDDTFVTQEYVLSVNDFMKGDREVFLPSIVSLNQRRYPKVNKVAGDFNGELSELSVVSILSGLLIKEDTIRRLKCKFGDVFDHRFNIYGVDTTLFYRLKSINFDRYYVGGILEHDLSGVSAGGAQYISMFTTSPFNSRQGISWCQHQGTKVFIVPLKSHLQSGTDL